MTRRPQETARRTPGPDAAARKGNHGGRPLVVTDDMLHTVLRRRANGETVEDIKPDLLIPTGRRKRYSPSLSSTYRGTGRARETQAYPEPVETEHSDFAALQQRDRSPKRYTPPGGSDTRTGPSLMRSGSRPSCWTPYRWLGRVAVVGQLPGRAEPGTPRREGRPLRSSSALRAGARL